MSISDATSALERMSHDIRLDAVADQLARIRAMVQHATRTVKRIVAALAAETRP